MLSISWEESACVINTCWTSIADSFCSCCSSAGAIAAAAAVVAVELLYVAVVLDSDARIAKLQSQRFKIAERQRNLNPESPLNLMRTSVEIATEIAVIRTAAI